MSGADAFVFTSSVDRHCGDFRDFRKRRWISGSHGKTNDVHLKSTYKIDSNESNPIHGPKTARRARRAANYQERETYVACKTANRPVPRDRQGWRKGGSQSGHQSGGEIGGS